MEEKEVEEKSKKDKEESHILLLSGPWAVISQTLPNFMSRLDTLA